MVAQGRRCGFRRRPARRARDRQGGPRGRSATGGRPQPDRSQGRRGREGRRGTRRDRRSDAQAPARPLHRLPRQLRATAEAPAAAQAVSASAAKEKEKSPRSTPTARKAAEQHEVDLNQVRGSGDAGRVMRRDVEQAARGSAPVSKPAPEGAVARPSPPVSEAPRRPDGERTEERVRMSKRRATIARRLVEAQSTAAMLTTFNEVDMTAVMALRERHKQSFKERHGVGLGIASFFVKASIGALRDVPADQRRDPGRRDRPQALLRHRRGRWRKRRDWWFPFCAMSIA